MPQIITSKVVMGMEVFYRPNSSDESIIKEVIEGENYIKPSVGFRVLPGETWLDLGANVGAFAVYCHSCGAVAHCYEPEPKCFQVLKNNTNYPGFQCFQEAVSTSTTLTLCFQRNEKSRGRFSPPSVHSRGSLLRWGTKRDGQTILVRNKNIKEIKYPYDGVKIDIEGGEFALLDAGQLPICKKLVIEYHSTRDKNLENLGRRLRFLKSVFEVVSYPPELDRLIEKGGQSRTMFDRLIFCVGRRSNS